MTDEQNKALEQLSAAVVAATDSGLFDSAEAWDAIGPDEINAFCDGVAELKTATLLARPSDQLSAE